MKQSVMTRGVVVHAFVIAMLWLSITWPSARRAFAAVPPAISLTTPGSAYTQNFDTLANTANSIDNALTIDGWTLTETGTSARNNGQYAVDAGASNTGDMYSYGDAGATDRALGELRSGTLVPLFGAAFTNNTGAAVTSLAVAYTGEQWRLGTTGRSDQLSFEYSTDATSLSTGTWTNVAALNFVTPDTGTVGAKNGNAASARASLAATLTGLTIANGATFWFRWSDSDATSADDGLAVDDFSLTPQASAATLLTVGDVSQAEGDSPGTTTFSFSVSLTAPAGAGGVTFDIATADGTAQDGNPASEDGDYVAQSLSAQSIPAGSSGPYLFDVTVNHDTTPEPNETLFVNVTNLTGAGAGDTQGQGTIVNDDTTVLIHDIQGSGSASPLSGSTVTLEGVVTASFQASSQLRGFFVQEEDADADANPATSEGIFVFCNTCSTAVAEGQRVQVSGVVSEFFGMTEITPGTVTVIDAGNHLAELTPHPIDLPVVGDIDAFYEPREGMLVTFVDTLGVSEYFELFRFGQIELYEGGRPRQYTDANAPSVAGYAAHLDALDRRRVILDDNTNTSNAPLTLADGLQFVFYPRANGGFSTGTQGTDFFRGGDLVSGLTGVLHWSNAGSGSADAWRIRPTAAHPATFTVANPRPVAAPSVGGAIQAVSMNLLNYFTTIDTTASSSSGPCGPAAMLDCRGADSAAELNRQRERASIVICALDADVYAFMELENTTASDTISDLLGAVNTRCGGTNPYTFVNTGGTLGTDAIRVALIYRTNVLAPIGVPLVDLDPVHNRPPTAQTFDVVDAANPAFGKRFTVIANHFKSKGCPGTGADADGGDGQGCFNATRTAQAQRLLAWVTNTVVPAAGDPRVLLLGDFNSYAREDPVTTLTGNGYTDLADLLLGSTAYSYLFDGQLGHLDYAFASTSLAPHVVGADIWHINADEVPLFDYNDEVRDSPGEASFEEKPDGSALLPARVMFQPASPFRASDHDPVIVGLFTLNTQADLTVATVDTPDPVTPGSNLTYAITVTNNGPDAASAASMVDNLPAGTTFVSLAAPAGWTCTTPAVGANGTISCSIAAMPVGNAAFTLAVQVDANTANGTVLSNTASVSSTTGDPAPGNQNGTATTTIAADAPPAVTINQAASQADPTSAGPINFTVSFSEPVTDFDDPADVTLSGTAGATSVTITGSGTTYNVAVSGMIRSGTVIASIPAGVAVDGAANPNTASSSTDNTVTFAPPGPVVTGIAPASSNPTNAAAVQFTVTFSANVSGVDAGDFSLVASGLTGASISGVTGSGASRIVTIFTGSGSGTLGLNLVDDDSIVNAANIPLGAIGPGNGDFIGQVYMIDKSAPLAGNLVAGAIGSAGGMTHSFTLVYSDNLAIEIASLDDNDIRVTGPGGFSQFATLVSVAPTTDGTPRVATYRVSAAGGTWDATDNGSYTLTIESNQVRDTSGNAVATQTLGSFTVDIKQQYTTFLPLVLQPAAAPAPSGMTGANRQRMLQ